MSVDGLNPLKADCRAITNVFEAFDGTGGCPVLIRSSGEIRIFGATMGATFHLDLFNSGKILSFQRLIGSLFNYQKR